LRARCRACRTDGGARFSTWRSTGRQPSRSATSSSRSGPNGRSWSTRLPGGHPVQILCPLGATPTSAPHRPARRRRRRPAPRSPPPPASRPSPNGAPLPVSAPNWFSLRGRRTSRRLPRRDAPPSRFQRDGRRSPRAGAEARPGNHLDLSTSPASGPGVPSSAPTSLPAGRGDPRARHILGPPGRTRDRCLRRRPPPARPRPERAPACASRRRRPRHPLRGRLVPVRRCRPPLSASAREIPHSYVTAAGTRRP